MGASRLILIGPEGDLSHEAKQGAAHAQSILRGATIYPTLADFHAAEGSGVRIALSGRDGSLHGPRSLDVLFNEWAEQADHLINQSKLPLYLMFGPEDDGLSNEEMQLCHAVCYLPTFGEITSLNLSHAVLLALYIARAGLKSRVEETSALVQQEPAPEPLYYPSETIRKWLETLGFDLTAKRVNVEKTLNRIFLSHAPAEEELRILDSVLQQTVRRLKK
jgi:TrmH family RNA methyltransferase